MHGGDTTYSSLLLISLLPAVPVVDNKVATTKPLVGGYRRADTKEERRIALSCWLRLVKVSCCCLLLRRCCATTTASRPPPASPPPLPSSTAALLPPPFHCPPLWRRAADRHFRFQSGGGWCRK